MTVFGRCRRQCEWQAPDFEVPLAFLVTAVAPNTNTQFRAGFAVHDYD